MTNEQLAVYLEQLSTNLGRLINDAQNQLTEDGIVYVTEQQLINVGVPIEMLNWKTVFAPEFREVMTEKIEALQPLFWFVENLQQTILTLDPNRIINHDK